MISEIKQETIQNCISIKTSLKIQVREAVKDFLESFPGQLNVSNLVELPEKKENYRISGPVSQQFLNTFYGYHKVDNKFQPCCFRVYQPAQLSLFRNEIRSYKLMGNINEGIHQLHEIIFSNDSQVVILCLDYRRFSPFNVVSSSLSNNISIVSKNSNISYIYQILQKLIFNLYEIHKCNLCHRNISPASVVINYSRNYNDCPVVITDFSCSYRVTNNVCKPLKVVGYLNYLAPELLTSNAKKQIDYMKVDIWAAGCLVHDLVAQTNPFFLGKTKEEVIVSINNNLKEGGDLNKEIKKAWENYNSNKFNLSDKIFVILSEMLHRKSSNRKSAEWLISEFFKDK